MVNLINADHVYISEHQNKYFVNMEFYGYTIAAGIYPTKEKATKALERLMAAYEHGAKVFEMPKE